MEVTVLGVVEVFYGSCQTIPYVIRRLRRHELGKGSIGNGLVVLDADINHLGIALERTLGTYDGDDVALVDAHVGPLLALAVLVEDAVDIYLTREVSYIEVAVKVVGDLPDVAGQTVLGIAVGSRVDLGSGRVDDRALLEERLLGGVLLALIVLGSEGNGHVAVAEIVVCGLEGHDGSGSSSADRSYREPLLGLCGNLDSDTVALAVEGHADIASLERERSILGID